MAGAFGSSTRDSELDLSEDGLASLFGGGGGLDHEEFGQRLHIQDKTPDQVHVRACAQTNLLAYTLAQTKQHRYATTHLSTPSVAK
jgi:hypothetical protein